MSEWVERTIRLGDAEITLREMGSGKPILVLHDEQGAGEVQVWQEELSKSRKLIMPVIPGFRGERISWLRSVQDLSRLWGRLIRELQLVPVDVIGFSFGGWVAAEMAIDNPSQFSKMVLVAPFGIKAPEGYITDMFIVTSAEYIRTSFAEPDKTPEFTQLFNSPSPEMIEAWEDARRECAELGWEPYMHNPSMVPLLKGLGGLKTLTIWGAKDAHVPESVVRAYEAAIPQNTLKIIAGSGHHPELEAREEFVKSVSQFFG